MMHLLVALPASVKIGSIFFLILAVHRLGIPLGLSIVINAVLLGFWSDGTAGGPVFQAATVLGPESLLLVTAIVLLLFFTESLGASGRMAKTVHALKKSFNRPRLLLAGLPALIGLLPMPGGAIFSAPLVEALDSGKHLESKRKTAINYWFRHIWEYWWPLYPGVILALKYSGLPVAVFFCIQAPLTLVSILGGYLFILRKLRPPRHEEPHSSRPPEKGALGSALVPIGLVVLIAVAGSFALPLAGVRGSLASLVAMIAGLVLALAVVLLPSPEGFRTALKIFRRPAMWGFVVLVIGVQAFSAVLKRPMGPEAVTLVGLMRDEFLRLGIPLIAVMMAIPFVSGMVTGVAMGFVGASFPLVFGLLGANPSMGQVLGLTTLAYGFGYLGMMLSPVHICFVVSCEYFKNPMTSVYRLILGPVLTVAVGILSLSALYYLVF